MEVHIGQLIKSRLEEVGMKKSEFARRINKTNQNLYDIFTRKSIDTDLLKTISTVLMCNFFASLAQAYERNGELRDMALEPLHNYNKNTVATTNNQHLEHELALCHERNNQLKQEISYLKEINALLKPNKR